MSFPAFQLSNYKIDFPFFAPNGEEYLEVVARDDVLKEINRCVRDRITFQKYRPIVISTSRGMGKTFLLKIFGMQKVPEHLACAEVQKAGLCGRILSFDFSRDDNTIQSDDDVYTFFQRLMVFYLCRLFDGSNVDGINFARKDMLEISDLWRSKTTRSGGKTTLDRWFQKCYVFRVDEIIDEYIRLTNIAFDVNYDFPPVFLLDEVGMLAAAKTNRISKFDGSRHTWLSLLLTQLEGKRRPLSISTGTNNGRILDITEMSAMIPLVLSLSPFTREEDYWNYWDQMTAYKNRSRESNPVNISHDNLSLSLIYSSYQIPRLLYTAHGTLFERLSEGVRNRNFILQDFESRAKTYYSEMFGLLENNNFSDSDIAHIVLACGVYWFVRNTSDCVPGTQIPYDILIRRSIIFPYGNGSYVFPFKLIWNAVGLIEGGVPDKRNEIQKLCGGLVPNLDIHDLHVEFDQMFSYDLYNLGLSFERMFVSALATKYYLFGLSNSRADGYVKFSRLYNVEISDKKTIEALQEYSLNLSDGIVLDTKERFVNEGNLPKCIIHNRNVHNAHHDIILHSNHGGIPVSSKYSSTLDGKDIEKQKMVRRGSNEKAKLLIWLYLGNDNRENLYDDLVVFLNGSGCCSSMSLDICVLVKKMQSEMNKKQKM